MGYQVIDHHAQIAVGAVEDHGRGLTGGTGRIQSSNQALRPGFFIAGGAIDLTR